MADDSDESDDWGGAEIPPDRAVSIADGLEESRELMDEALDRVIADLRADEHRLSVAGSVDLDHAIGVFAGAQKSLKHVFLEEYFDGEGDEADERDHAELGTLSIASVADMGGTAVLTLKGTAGTARVDILEEQASGFVETAREAVLVYDGYDPDDDDVLIGDGGIPIGRLSEGDRIRFRAGGVEHEDTIEEVLVETIYVGGYEIPPSAVLEVVGELRNVRPGTPLDDRAEPDHDNWGTIDPRLESGR